MNDYGHVPDNIDRIRERMDTAARRAGRDSASVELMAVTKFHPLEAATAAYGAGIRLFGENRVQEAESKYADAGRTFPGARSSSSAACSRTRPGRPAPCFPAVESVDSCGLLGELEKRSRAQGKVLDILLELHTGEESKAGFGSLDGLLSACDLLLGLEADRAGQGAGGLRLRGLMTMAPYTQEEAPVRASFRALHAAFETVSRRYHFPAFAVLSMGMTNDFEIAIEEGATLIRIGTAIFGTRSPA